MEVITFESEAYKNIVKKIDMIADFVQSSEQIKNRIGDNEIWLDSQELAAFLRISTRTLQRLRADKLINYTILRGRCLYSLSEIERMLNEKIITADPEAVNELRNSILLKNGIKKR